MQVNEIEKIYEGDDFSKNLKEYLLKEIDNDRTNPFGKEITKKTILNTIIHCTILIATLIYISNKESDKVKCT